MTTSLETVESWEERFEKLSLPNCEKEGFVTASFIAGWQIDKSRIKAFIRAELSSLKSRQREIMDNKTERKLPERIETLSDNAKTNDNILSDKINNMISYLEAAEEKGIKLGVYRLTDIHSEPGVSREEYESQPFSPVKDWEKEWNTIYHPEEQIIFIRSLLSSTVREAEKREKARILKIVEAYEVTRGVKQYNSYQIGENHGRQTMQRDLIKEISKALHNQ